MIPRLLARGGAPATIHLKRFHSYGLGESHVDALLTGVEELVPDGSVKLGFRAHYPQLETKLTVRGADMDDVRRKLEPVQAEVRKRLGNFIMAEDDQTLEGVVLAELTRQGATLALVETFTSGQIAARIGHLPGAEHVLRARRHRARPHRTAQGARHRGLRARRRSDPGNHRGGGAGRARSHRRDARTGGADRS